MIYHNINIILSYCSPIGGTLLIALVFIVIQNCSMTSNENCKLSQKKFRAENCRVDKICKVFASILQTQNCLTNEGVGWPTGRKMAGEENARQLA